MLTAALSERYSSSPIFSALAEKDLHELISRGRQTTYSKGETIFLRGDEGAWVLLLEDGLVEISVVSTNGRKAILNLMEKYDIVGEIALLDNEPRSANATAKTNVSGIVLSRATMMDFLRDNPEACFEVIHTLCKRVRNTSDLFEAQSLPNANARLARCILRLADKWGEPTQKGATRVSQQLSQTELGEISGIARENVNRYINAWTKAAILTFDRGTITVLDAAELENIAEI
jgi:CRP-like cAMP-binding protein